MKELHLIASKDETRPAMMHIQVKENFVNVTDSYALISLPVEEVFGEDIIADGEELYFLGSDWLASKMHKAVNIRREGLTFFASDAKHKSLGFIIATKDVNDFPAFKTVFPDENNKAAVDMISFNSKRLFNLCTAFGQNLEHINYSFFGNNKGIIVRSKESKGVGLLMPTLLLATLPEVEEATANDNDDSFLD